MEILEYDPFPDSVQTSVIDLGGCVAVLRLNIITPKTSELIMAIADMSLLTLVPATREQTLQSRHRTSKEWGRGISEEEYLERDAITDRSEVSRDGRLITW